MISRRTIGKTILATATALLMAGTAHAQEVLKWAHVYETSEPFHTESVWAAEEIEKRTEGRYTIDVFPASQLGKETDINQGLTLGTVDIIISGSSFAAREYAPIGVTYFPYIFRDADHLLAYTKSDVFKRLTKGYEEASGHHITAVTYYGTRHTTSNKPIAKCADMRGPEDPRAGRAGLSRHAARLRRQHRADRLRRGLSRAAERHGRGAGEPADHDRGEEVLRGAEAHRADRPYRRPPQHDRLEDALGQLSDADKAIFTEVMQEAAARATGRSSSSARRRWSRASRTTA